MKVQYIVDKKELDSLIWAYLDDMATLDKGQFDLDEIEYCCITLNGQQEFSHVKVRGQLYPTENFGKK